MFPVVPHSGEGLPGYRDTGSELVESVFAAYEAYALNYCHPKSIAHPGGAKIKAPHLSTAHGYVRPEILSLYSGTSLQSETPEFEEPPKAATHWRARKRQKIHGRTPKPIASKKLRSLSSRLLVQLVRQGWAGDYVYVIYVCVCTHVFVCACVCERE